MYTIATEHPMAAVLSKQFQDSHCATCFCALGSGETFLTCDDCLEVSYCSLKCQRTDWKAVHQQECEILRSQQGKQLMTTTMRLCIRVLLVISKGSQKPTFNGAVLTDLDTNYEEFRSSSSHNEFISDIMAVVRTAGHNIFPTSLSNDKVFAVICSILCNSFSIIDEQKVEAVGVGLYIGIAKHNHACSSTSHIVFNGTEAVLRSNTNVYSESLTISYVSRMLPTSARRKSIRGVHFITCQCEFCLDEEADLIALASRCSDQNCSGFVKGERCEVCGRKSLSSQEEVSQATMALIDKLENFFKNNEDEKTKNEYSRLCKLRDDYGKLLADCNVAMLQLDEQIAYCASNLPEDQLPDNLQQVAMQGYEHFIARLHLGAPEVTRRLYIACKCLARGSKAPDAKFALLAYQSSCTSHGETHYISKFLSTFLEIL